MNRPFGTVARCGSDTTPRAEAREHPAARRALCPGSFDPVTNGHLDIVNRAAALYDEVFVAVFVNPSKGGLFSLDERMEMLGEVTAHLPNVSVSSFQGLTVDFCRANDIGIIVKGIRAVSDFDYEQQMAQMNYGLAGVETLFMPRIRCTRSCRRALSRTSPSGAGTSTESFRRRSQPGWSPGCATHSAECCGGTLESHADEWSFGWGHWIVLKTSSGTSKPPRPCPCRAVARWIARK